MNKQELITLYEYNAWSNAKILSAAASITPEQFTAPTAFPHGSLRGTLTHALFAEGLWRMRWEGTPSAPGKMKPEDFPTVESLRTRWAEEESHLIDFVVKLPEERLYTVLKYVSTEGIPHKRVLWETMAHLINHGTQHKTEAAAILTSLDYSPGILI